MLFIKLSAQGTKELPLGTFTQLCFAMGNWRKAEGRMVFTKKPEISDGSINSDSATVVTNRGVRQYKK